MENERQDEGLARLGVILPASLLKDSKHFAIEQNTTLSEIVRTHLEQKVGSKNTAKKQENEANEN